MTRIVLFLLFGILCTGGIGLYFSPAFAESNIGNPTEFATDGLDDIGKNQHLTRPTFGISHESNEIIVDNGFKFNEKSFLLNSNHHTSFTEQTISIGKVNSFEVTTYAQKGLKVQEFLFGIPIVGQANLAELGVEVWYGHDGEISKVIAIQKSNVIDKDNILATHEKSKCKSSDVEKKCDTTKISIIFQEPLKDKVMAIKAIDYKNRYQITYLNDGFDISNESLNPMKTAMIPSEIKGEGLVKVTQTEKYSPYWMTEDGRKFVRNDFGSFMQINHSFERFQDSGDPLTRNHSGFGGILKYEKQRALRVFDATTLLSQIPDAYSHNISINERITDDMKVKMTEQEQIAQKNLQYSVQARFY